MNEQNDFEKQVEREERAYAEPERAEAEEAASGAANDLVEKIKELVKKGNVTKIVVKKDDNVLVNIPLNVGIVGGIFGVAAAPWAVVAAAVATAGFSCKVELVKDDGGVVHVTGKTIGDKAKDVSSAVAESFRDVVDSIKAEEPDIEIEIEEEPEAPAAPAEESKTEE